MDPLSVSASVVAILQMTETVLSFLNDIKSASQEQKQLTIEASSLYGLLTTLRFRIESSNPTDGWFTTIRSLTTEGGPLDQFGSALERLMSKAGLLETSSVKKFGKRIAWSLEKNEIKGLLMKIERLKSVIILALTNDLFTLTQKLEGDITAVQDGVTALRIDGERRDNDSELRKIENWLSRLDFHSRHRAILAQTQEGTGQWLIESEEFRSWMSGANETLWCPGIPGAGKTFLSSIVIDHLQTMFKDENTAVMCLFCNYQEQEEQTAVSLMASLLKQLVQASRKLSTNISRLYENNRPRDPSFTDLAVALSSELGAYTKAFVVMDALDETSKNGDIRSSFLPKLQSLPVNLFVTSRHSPTIEGLFLHGSRRQDIRASDEDLKKFVKERISSTPLLARHIKNNLNLEELIEAKIVAKAKGMFLLAQFHMDSVSKESKIKGVREALERLPSKLNDSYDKVMERIKNDDFSKLALRVLLWVSHTFEPLSLTALRQAIAIEPGATGIEEEDLDDEEIMISICAGLVVFDKQTDTVRLVQYFNERRGLFFPDGNANIATVCLTCLTSDYFDDWVKSTFSDDEYDYFSDVASVDFSCFDGTLLLYASTYWGTHVRGEAELMSMDLILEFLYCTTKSFRAGKIRSKEIDESEREDFSSCCLDWEKLDIEDFHGIILAVSLGLTAVVEKLLSPKQEQNPSRMPPANSFKIFSLSIALEYGHKDIVQLLLNDVGMDLEEQKPAIMTPIMTAASVGDVAVTLELIRRRAPLDTKDYRGMTALHHAASQRHASTARSLLDAGADVEARDDHGWNIAFHAVSADHERLPMWAYNRGINLDLYKKQRKERWNQIAALLLEYRVNLIIVNEDQETILHESAKSADMDIMRFCVTNGVKIQSKDSFQRQCLWNVLIPLVYRDDGDDGDEQSAIEIFRWLMENGANVNDSDLDEQTVLFEACRRNYPRLSLWLLMHGADPLIVDKEGRLAIFYAVQVAFSGNISRPTVLAFLEHGTPINHKDYRGFTVLHEAVCNTSCPREVFEILIDDFGAKLTERDLEGRMPFHYAFTYGSSVETIDFLLSRGADVNEQDFEGRTPLHLGISHAFELQEMAEHLFTRGLGVNNQDHERRKPLHYLTRALSLERVDLLLTRGAEVNKPDLNGRTVFHLFRYGTLKNLDVAKLLISKGADVNQQDHTGRTLLHYLARDSSFRGVEFLLSRGADVNKQDFEGRTALHKSIYALMPNEWLDTEILRWPLPRLELERTPAILKTIELLLSRGADILIKDFNGHTVLENLVIQELFTKNSMLERDYGIYECLKRTHKILREATAKALGYAS